MLRNQGYNCDLYYSTDKIKKQFKYAQSKDYSFAVIMGEEEIEKNIVQIKNLKKFSQEEVNFDLLKNYDFNN